jgi:hypothetical protein
MHPLECGNFTVKVGAYDWGDDDELGILRATEFGKTEVWGIKWG